MLRWRQAQPPRGGWNARTVAAQLSAAGWRASIELAHPAATAIDKTAILLHPPLPLVGVSIRMARGCQWDDSLVDGQAATPAHRLVAGLRADIAALVAAAAAGSAPSPLPAREAGCPPPP